MIYDRSILEAALIGYQERQKEIEQKIEEIHQQLGQAAPVGTGKPRKGISEEGRARIAEAQRRRWAKLKKGKENKRQISAAGRQRIAAAAKKRWAEYRTAKAGGK